MDSTLTARLAEICGAENVISDPQQLRTYECDGLTAHRCSPGLVVLPRSAEQVAAIVRECAAGRIPFVARGSGTGLSGGALPRGRRRADRHLQDAQHHRDRRGQPPRDRRTRRHQPRGQQGRRAVRPVLRAGPVQPGRLLGRRQRRGELRRRALPQARLHRPSRDRPGDRHPAGRADLARRRNRQRARLRPGRRVHRLGGHARHRHQDRRQADARSRRQ